MAQTREPRDVFERICYRVLARCALRGAKRAPSCPGHNILLKFIRGCVSAIPKEPDSCGLDSVRSLHSAPSGDLRRTQYGFRKHRSTAHAWSNPLDMMINEPSWIVTLVYVYIYP